MFGSVVLILSILIVGLTSVCPPSEIISPCTCNEDNIKCEGNTDIDLVRIFKSLGESKYQKNYKTFLLNNTYINELKAFTFRSITFDKIRIDGCDNLTSIDRNAFGKTNLVTDEININDNAKLSSPDNSIYDVLGKFVNASNIFIAYNNFREIPKNAFKPIMGYQERLTDLTLAGNFDRIEEKAFYYLNSLKRLEVSYSNIDYIPNNAFAFEENSDSILELVLYVNQFVKNHNFTKYTLSSINRPINLQIDYEEEKTCIDYLDEKIFLTFLLKNISNKIINSCPFNCDDCRNSWLKEDPVIQTRIIPLKCSNNNSISDAANFKNCN